MSKWKDQPTEDDLIDQDEALLDDEEDIDDPWMDCDDVDPERVQAWHDYVEGE